jgi:NAD(P)H-hydrate epimerase
MEQYLFTSDTQTIAPVLRELYIPDDETHKGENGKTLIIGGSHLFHASSLWSAEVAAYIVDMLHYASTVENAELFQSLKYKFRNGIIVQQKDIPYYVEEDDSILVGPGMVRMSVEKDLPEKNFEEILHITDEAEYTYYITRYLITSFPHKRFVFDAGALQMMHPEWLKKLNTAPILCPHQLEFEKLFGIPVKELSLEDKIIAVTQAAREYRAVIMLKAVKDIITDGTTTYIIEGGNPGLTKGGTGDVLAGLTAALYTKNTALHSAVLASYLLKRTADELAEKKGNWFTIANLIDKVPDTLKKLQLQI